MPQLEPARRTSRRDRQRARKLRVVFVDHVARLSGGEIALLRLLPELTKHVDVTVLLGEDGPLAERLEAQGIEVEVMSLPVSVRDLRRDRVRPGRLTPAVPVRAIRYALQLRRRIRELEADIVHTNSLKAALYGGAAGRLAPAYVVWHIRDRISEDYLPRPAVRLVRTASRFIPHAVVADFRETLSTVPRRRRTSVVYNAIVPDTAGPVPGEEARGEVAAPVLGMLGRLTPWKGQDVFLDAFAQAFRGTAVRGRLIGSAMFGEDAFAEQLNARAEELGIADQIEFRGFREDVWSELRELDVLVHCSVRPEPFGQVVLEGLAAGVPVVAARAGGPAEVITNGVDGILTTPGDASELADELRRLVDDAALRARLAEGGRRRSRDFSPEQTVARLLEVYSDLVGPN